MAPDTGLGLVDVYARGLGLEMASGRITITVAYWGWGKPRSEPTCGTFRGSYSKAKHICASWVLVLAVATAAIP